MNERMATFVNKQIYTQLKKRVVITILLIFVIVLPTVWMAGYHAGRAQAGGSTPVFEYPAGSYSYLIWKEGNVYYAKNGRTGAIDYSGTASYVLQNAFSAGGRVLLKDGVYDLGSTSVALTSNLVIQGESRDGTIIRTSSGGTLHGTSLENITIQDLTFHRTPTGNNSLFRDFKFFTARNVRIKWGLSGAGETLWRFQGGHNYTFEHVIFDHSHMSVGNYGNERSRFWNFIDCTWINPRDDGITFNGDYLNMENIFVKLPDDSIPGTGGRLIMITTGKHIQFNNIIVYGQTTRSGIAIGFDTNNPPNVQDVSINNYIQYGGAAGIGIAYSVEGVTISNAKFYDITTHGITFVPTTGNYTRNVVISNSLFFDSDGTHFTQGAIRFEVSSGIENITVVNNIFNVMTRLNNPSYVSNLIVKHNQGYATENSGITTIPAGGTSVVVNHGLAGTPTIVTVTPSADLGDVWVDTLTSTQFTIHSSTAPASDTTVYWYAEYKP